MSTITKESELEEIPTPEPPDPEDALFNKSAYDLPELALPKVDGESTDRIALRFSGTVFLNRLDPADVALMNAMKLGSDITLQIEGRCAKKGWGFTTDREGDLDVVKLEHAINVHTVYRPVT